MSILRFTASSVASMLLFIMAVKPVAADPNYSFKEASMPGVTIINSNSPEFLPAVNSLVDPAILPSIQAVLPFSYVLKNNTSKFIIVYSTRWTLTDPSGTNHHAGPYLVESLHVARRRRHCPRSKQTRVASLSTGRSQRSAYWNGAHAKNRANRRGVLLKSESGDLARNNHL